MAGRTDGRSDGSEERNEGEGGRKEGAERDASTAPGLRPGRDASTTTKNGSWQVCGASCDPKNRSWQVCRCAARGGVSYSETRHHGVGPSLGSGLRSSAVIEGQTLQASGPHWRYGDLGAVTRRSQLGAPRDQQSGRRGGRRGWWRNADRVGGDEVPVAAVGGVVGVVADER
jgi:hypothetical protein